MKKAIALTLAAVLALGSFAGCGGAPASGQSGTGSSVSGQQMDGGGETLTLLTNLNVDTEGCDPNDNDYINYVREKTNINLELIVDGTPNYTQKVNTMMASQSAPDLIMLNGDWRSELNRWANEGLLIPLDDYLEDYPDIKANIGQTAWDMTVVNGETYAFPAQRYDPSPYLTFARKDWLENLGIDPNEIKTVDDWYEMLKRFTTDDPDGNGVDDTYGIAAQMTSSTGLPADFTISMFMDAFGAAKAKVVDGELLPNYILPEYKEWLKFMNKLYEEKILDPEYLVTSGTQLWDKVASNKYGSFMWFWGLQEYQSKNLDRENLVAIAPPEKVDGSGRSSYIYTSPVRHVIAITSNCKNPELAMEFVNWTLSEEGGVFLYAGLEGKDYTIEDGVITMLEDRKGKNLAWRYLTVGVINPNITQEPFSSIMAQSNGELGMEHLALSNEYGGYDDLALACPVFPELAQYDLLKSAQEFTDKAITGKIDIDAEWDDYVAAWRKAGGDLKIELSTKWYNEEYNK